LSSSVNLVFVDFLVITYRILSQINPIRKTEE
jgi:hypothetical protein